MDGKRVLDKGKFKDEFNNPCVYRCEKQQNLDRNFFSACSTYVQVSWSYNLFTCYLKDKTLHLMHSVLF